MAFFNVRNILGRDPVQAGNVTYFTVNTLPNVYDYLGRIFRAGVRVRFK